MKSTTQVGRLVGGLMLLHLACGLIGPYVVLVPITAPPAGFLDNAAPMAAAIRASVCVLVVGALVPLFIAIAMAPMTGRALSLWLLAIAGVNLALQFVENAHWLTMLSVSEAYQHASDGSQAAYAATSVAVRSAFKWAHYTHIFVLVAWLLVLYATFLQARLVPRWLAAAGVVAALLHAFGITLPEFIGYRVPSSSLWGIPLALVHVGAAAWLLRRGFARTAELEARAAR